MYSCMIELVPSENCTYNSSFGFAKTILCAEKFSLFLVSTKSFCVSDRNFFGYAAGEVQRPHRHNSVALDLAVKAAPGTYTLMGKELDSHGWVKDPVRCVLR